MSTVYSVDVTIRAPVAATEVTDRVVDAVEHVFPGVTVEEHPGEVRATTHSLESFSERLHEAEILDSARMTFLQTLSGDTFTFRLNKQAAYAGRLTFAVGDPAELGDIEVEVTVRDPDPETYVDHVAPPTEDGVPIDPADRRDER
ncbi:RNA-binding domain-containing protein [Halomarina ordinaria]|uniref:UPF0201 protein ACFQHK_12945 n=1 Tax=Halomarina ordinaria TaxID=3033939 RepID=A0ABD5UAE2_9EURY|nr:RNA-binding domain-containing protein [Halomarina sp. PSRA2]